MLLNGSRLNRLELDAGLIIDETIPVVQKEISFIK